MTDVAKIQSTKSSNNTEEIYTNEARLRELYLLIKNRYFGYHINFYWKGYII